MSYAKNNHYRDTIDLKCFSSIHTKKTNFCSVPNMLWVFIISIFLNPHIIPICNTKVPYIANIRCVTNYTTIKSCRNKVTLISRNISFLSNISLLRMMMHMMQFVHFLLYWLITSLNKDSFTRT